MHEEKCAETLEEAAKSVDDASDFAAVGRPYILIGDVEL